MPKCAKAMIFVNVKVPKKNNKILKYNPGEKSLNVPFIIYEDLECILQKIDTCQNNPEKSSTEKKAEHKPSGDSVHSINQKLNGIIIEEKIVQKDFAKS